MQKDNNLTIKMDLDANYETQQVIGKFNAIADHIYGSAKKFLGYPVNENTGLASFYKWYAQSDLLNLSLNNAGDPFEAGHLQIDCLELEKELILDFARELHFEEGRAWGMIGTGGTDGNHHGIYFGSNYLFNKCGQRPIVYVSEEAHYSNRRLGVLNGLEVRIVPVDEMGCMDPAALARLVDSSKPALMVYALGTTFKGAIDNVPVLDKVLADNGVQHVYRHMDAALFGAYFPYIQRYDLVGQQELGYDSIAISGHKFFGTDEPCGVFICRKEIFESQKQDPVPYLNSDMVTISCSRSSQAVMKLYWLLKTRSRYAFIRDTMICLKNTKYLYDELKKRNWPAWVGPASNTVFFKKPSDALVHKYILATDHDERLGGDLTHIIVMQHVRQPLLDDFLRDLDAERQ